LRGRTLFWTGVWVTRAVFDVLVVLALSNIDGVMALRHIIPRSI
jgi:hypothetical protein